MGRKTLTLVRHAKSSWDHPGLPDRLRPLNRRGERDAPRMGERLAARGVEVERIVTSPAARATATAELVAEEIGFPWDAIVVDERLYQADAFDILAVIRELDDYLDHVMLFGHNPGLTDLVNSLSTHVVDNVPTCGVVELEYEIDGWALVGKVEPRSFFFDYPKKK
ncbi:MAG: histidine phosphatase family protein [Anaerolineae bacterium]|nr:histidine phosphatase family protein [Anaerolineae bacterium]